MIHRPSTQSRGWTLTLVLILAGASVLAWPADAAAQTFTGQARAVQATVTSLFGNSTTTLADAGTLSDPSEPRHATAQTGTIGSLFSGEVLHAATMGWTDQAASQASVGSLALTLGVARISAASAAASAVAGATGSASSVVGNLAVNGVPVFVTGTPNQIVPIPGGRLIINEQIFSPDGVTVNALHVTVTGVADVVVASATAGTM